MAKKRSVRYERGDEDKCQKRSSPRWYAICANSVIRMSIDAAVKKDVRGRTRSMDST